ncbi:MAG TPA: type IV toxin-antitoxin system AbiEi family antitoxin domain-containing protein, partial [Acidimicrobiales bacterium]|nr:type IV toxin-antitoxin system AbiEi family antitoxin domain-containing protein [Acidimicrobiales bacterium]
ELAANQRGLFSAAQAASLGISYAQLSRAVRGGHLRRVRQGIYSIAGTPPSKWENMLSAALAVRDHGALSHSSAAAVHGFYCSGSLSLEVPGLVEVSVANASGVNLAHVKVHRVGELAAPDIVERYGVQITSPARTLVDIVPRLSLPVLERTLDEGLLAKLWTVERVRECLDRLPANRDGRSRLSRLLQLRQLDPSADSALEARVYRFLEELAPFVAHYVLTIGDQTFVLDAAWPEYLVALEIVGRSHRVVSRSAFERERRKLNALAAAGWRTAFATDGMESAEVLGSLFALCPQLECRAHSTPRRRAG